MDFSVAMRFNCVPMKLISFQKLGENRESPRLWLESRRLAALGFSPKPYFQATAGAETPPKVNFDFGAKPSPAR